MMPLAILPEMPKAWTMCRALRPSVAAAERMEAGVVDALGRDEAEAADRLDAHSDAEKRRRAFRTEALGDREHCRDHHGPGMHRTALKGIVEIFAMGGDAVDQRGRGGAALPCVADDSAGAVAVCAR
jgi:hypothetical protein